MSETTPPPTPSPYPRGGTESFFLVLQHSLSVRQEVSEHLTAKLPPKQQNNTHAASLAQGEFTQDEWASPQLLVQSSLTHDDKPGLLLFCVPEGKNTGVIMLLHRLTCCNYNYQHCYSGLLPLFCGLCSGVDREKQKHSVTGQVSGVERSSSMRAGQSLNSLAFKLCLLNLCPSMHFPCLAV